MPLGVMISLHQGLLLVLQSVSMLQPVHLSQPHCPVSHPGHRLGLLAYSMALPQAATCCGLTTVHCSDCATLLVRAALRRQQI